MGTSFRCDCPQAPEPDELGSDHAGKAPPRNWEGPVARWAAESCQVKPPSPREDRPFPHGWPQPEPAIRAAATGLPSVQKTAGANSTAQPVGTGSRITSCFTSPKDLSRGKKESHPESTLMCPTAFEIVWTWPRWPGPAQYTLRGHQSWLPTQVESPQRTQSWRPELHRGHQCPGTRWKR